MDDNAFIAGVIRGGLTSNRDIKILICYLLYKKGTLSRTVILEALSSNGLANYFECADALGDLETLGHISSTDDGYTINETGVEIATVLENDVPLTVRERAIQYLDEIFDMQLKKTQHHVDITEVDNGFAVRCSISDAGSVVFAVELFAPNKSVANSIRDKFIQNAESIMRSTLSMFIDDFD